MEEDSAEEEEEKHRDKAEDEVVEAGKGRIVVGPWRGSWWMRGDDWTLTASVLRETDRRILGGKGGTQG